MCSLLVMEYICTVGSWIPIDLADDLPLLTAHLRTVAECEHAAGRIARLPAGWLITDVKVDMPMRTVDFQNGRARATGVVQGVRQVELPAPTCP